MTMSRYISTEQKLGNVNNNMKEILTLLRNVLITWKGQQEKRESPRGGRTDEIEKTWIIALVRKRNSNNRNNHNKESKENYSDKFLTYGLTYEKPRKDWKEENTEIIWYTFIQKLKRKGRPWLITKDTGNIGMYLKDYIRMITSLRQEREVPEGKHPNTLFPGRVGLGSLIVTYDSESENEGASKAFWVTKDFNHIKINPNSPVHTDLLPAKADDIVLDRRFYQQSFVDHRLYGGILQSCDWFTWTHRWRWFDHRLSLSNSSKSLIMITGDQNNSFQI